MTIDRSLFDPAFLLKLGHVPRQLARLRVRPFEGGQTQAGVGGSLEFAGHRAYSPGDDARRVDWNAYARLRRPVVKDFAREAGPRIAALVDSSDSMRLFGKNVAAARIAATIAHLALADGGTLRLAFVQADGARVSRRLRGEWSREFPEALDFLSNGPAPVGGTQLEAGLRGGIRAAGARGSLFVISDFWLLPGCREAIAGAAALGHDVTLVHVLAAEERDPARLERAAGLRAPVQLVDSESGIELPADLADASAASYAQGLDRFIFGLHAFAARHRLRYRFVGAEAPLPEAALPLFLPRRSSR